MRKAINETKIVEIGGIKQYLLVRGNNCERPILLILHGGPGSALSSIASVFPKEIEDHFVVVHWDQRGAGKSYSETIDPNTMNVEQFINDTIEVTDFLLTHYNKEKIYLVGFSWGTVLGINAANCHPEKYYAYIGLSQVVDVNKGEEIAYDFLLEEAKKTGNEEAVMDLETIGRPPYKSDDDLLIQRKWLNILGFAERKIRTVELFMKQGSEEDLQLLMQGIGFAEATILNNINDYNIYHIEELEIPVYIGMGRYDYQTPFILAEEFYRNLKAPMKKFYWFEESAHATALEEPKRFVEILFDVLKVEHAS